MKKLEAPKEEDRCHWCRRVFAVVDGAPYKFKGMDGNFYCCEIHGSAPYLTRRESAL